MSKRLATFAFVGDMSIFGVRALGRAFIPPFELAYLTEQLEEIGARSLPLIAAAGIALGIVMTLHTRSTLVSFGAEAWAPTLQAVSFFNEIGPLVAALLISGRVGAGTRLQSLVSWLSNHEMMQWAAIRTRCTKQCTNSCESKTISARHRISLLFC